MVKQGVFAEDNKVAVCGSMDNCIFLYDLTQEPSISPVSSPHGSSIEPFHILEHRQEGAAQTVAVKLMLIIYR